MTGSEQREAARQFINRWRGLRKAGRSWPVLLDRTVI